MNYVSCTLSCLFLLVKVCLEVLKGQDCCGQGDASDKDHKRREDVLVLDLLVAARVTGHRALHV